MTINPTDVFLAAVFFFIVYLIYKFDNEDKGGYV